MKTMKQYLSDENFVKSIIMKRIEKNHIVEIIRHEEEIRPEQCEEGEKLQAIKNRMEVTDWGWCKVEVKVTTGIWEGSAEIGLISCFDKYDFRDNSGLYHTALSIAKNNLADNMHLSIKDDL